MSLPLDTRVIVSGEPYVGERGQIVPPPNAGDLANWPVWVRLDRTGDPAGFKEYEVAPDHASMRQDASPAHSP